MKLNTYTCYEMIKLFQELWIMGQHEKPVGHSICCSPRLWLGLARLQQTGKEAADCHMPESGPT